MTDASTGIVVPDPDAWPVPIRIGAWVEVVDGALIGRLRPHPAIVRHGVVEPAALLALIDMLGGLSCDDDPDHWVFTSTMSLRSAPVPAPDDLRCTVTMLRSGARSSTSEITLASADGRPLGVGFAAFSRVPRRPTDLPKPVFDLASAGEAWSKIPVLERPLRDAAGLRVVDAAVGHVELDVGPFVQNPAGALHGAMTSLVVESAAVELATSTLGGAHVGHDVDVRYLAQARVGPVATRARFVGEPEAGSIVVDVVDRGNADALVAVATVRTYRVAD